MTNCLIRDYTSVHKTKVHLQSVGKIIFVDSMFGHHQATGVRVGEVTENSAIVWTRLTKYVNRNHDGVAFDNRGEQQDPAPAAVPIEKIPVEKIEGACPGIAGRVRLRYGLTGDLRDAMKTAWTNVNEVTDEALLHKFSHITR